MVEIGKRVVKGGRGKAEKDILIHEAREALLSGRVAGGLATFVLPRADTAGKPAR
jgi:hypothetical protein